VKTKFSSFNFSILNFKLRFNPNGFLDTLNKNVLIYFVINSSSSNRIGPRFISSTIFCASPLARRLNLKCFDHEVHPIIITFFLYFKGGPNQLNANCVSLNILLLCVCCGEFIHLFLILMMIRPLLKSSWHGKFLNDFIDSPIFNWTPLF
jgi:hypothetical protein